MLAKDLPVESRDRFSEAFYGLVRGVFTLLEDFDDTDAPCPWGCPWEWGTPVSLVGDTPEEMAENFVDEHIYELLKEVCDELDFHEPEFGEENND